MVVMGNIENIGIPNNLGGLMNMSKKITSLFLALIMVLGMTLTAFPVSAAEETTGTLVITADKTRAKSGETIEIRYGTLDSRNSNKSFVTKIVSLP